MKRSILVVLLIVFSVGYMAAQVPYFAGTAGDGKLYGYTSVKFRPGINQLESYTTFQYGITDYFATGTDLYTCNNQVYSNPIWQPDSITRMVHGTSMHGVMTFSSRIRAL